MANVDEVRLTPRAMEMRRLIAEQQASGLTVAAFAARRGMTAGTLFHWRHRFRREISSIERPFLIPVHVVDDSADPEECVGRAAPSAKASPFLLKLRGARRISVPAGFSGDDLRRLIEVVESC